MKTHFNKTERLLRSLKRGHHFTEKQIAAYWGAENPTRQVHYLRELGHQIMTIRLKPGYKTRYALTSHA